MDMTRLMPLFVSLTQSVRDDKLKRYPKCLQQFVILVVVATVHYRLLAS